MKVNEMAFFCIDVINPRPLPTAWIILTFMYLGVLQLIGLILALRIRKVKVKALRDSKYIAAIIYVSTIALIVVAISLFALGSRLNAIEVLFSGSIIVATTLFLSLVFIPKVLLLLESIDLNVSN